MKPTHSGIIEVKDQIVAAIKGTGDIVQATVDAVTRILATTIKDTGMVGTSVTDVIANVASGAVHGVVQVGADDAGRQGNHAGGASRHQRNRRGGFGYRQPHRPGCGPGYSRGWSPEPLKGPKN